MIELDCDKLEGLARVRGVSDDYFPSACGQDCFLFSPEKSHIRIQDIAATLARIPRWGGRTSAAHSAWTVADHSLLVSKIVPRGFALFGLLHDAAEAYLGDVISPLKDVLNRGTSEGALSFSDLERTWMKEIGRRLDVPLHPLPRVVKAADYVALELERWDLVHRRVGGEVWGHEQRPATLDEIPELKPIGDEAWAYGAFMNRYLELGGKT